MKVQHTCGPIDKGLLLELEERIERKLPEDYVSFIIQTNGGRPDPDVVKIKELYGEETDVKVIFGVTRKVETSNLRSAIEVFKSFVEQGYLPIACDSGGWLFLLSLCDGEDYGHVYFIDPFMEYKLYFVASSFSQFLEKLRS